LRKKLNACHPFIEAQSRLAREVVQVRDQTFHDVLEARVAALRIYSVYILGDVFDSEVLEDGNRGGICALGRCHYVQRDGQVVGGRIETRRAIEAQSKSDTDVLKL